MGYCTLSNDSNFSFAIKNESLLNNFLSKHKEIIDLFEGYFLIKSAGNTYFLFYDEQVFEVSSNDFPVYDNKKPNKKRAIARFFSDVYKQEGDCGFSLGQEGFNTEFYKDLFELTVDKKGYGLVWGMTVDTGEDDFCSGNIELTENGLVLSF